MKNLFNKIIIGQCSICGGNVTIPNIWYGINPPIPHCDKCGATGKNVLPVILMQPLPYKTEKYTLAEKYTLEKCEIGKKEIEMVSC